MHYYSRIDSELNNDRIVASTTTGDNYLFFTPITSLLWRYYNFMFTADILQICRRICSSYIHHCATGISCKLSK